MLPQQFQRPEPPNKINTFMEKAGWPIITLTIGTVLAAIIIAVWIGKIQVLNFYWLTLLLVLVLLAITLFFMVYNLRTRSKLQQQHQADVAALKKELRALQDNYRDMINQELNRLNEWAISYSQANAKEQAERLEEVKNACKREVANTKEELTGIINSHNTNFSNRAIDHANAHGREQKVLNSKLDTLEQRLKDTKGL